ncbi:MAG: hypothetical protein GX998_11470 [Firmicutes bacterium]|nr:hypothetical protein [Bacillota bacterium]
MARDDIQAVEPFPLDELRPGMKGIGKTVVTGTKIEEFQVEILGVLAGQETVKKLILVQVSGNVIDRMGGIAAGMSGSPVYVNDKLVGAISYTFNLTDHRLGMVTPIEPMLEILQLANETVAWEPPYGVWRWADVGEQVRMVGDYSTEEICITMGSSPEGQVSYVSGCLNISPAATPLLVGGMGERARQRLAASLKPLGLETIAVSGSSAVALSGDGQAQPVIEPGSAFGVQLVGGDVGVMSLGTVTYRNGNEFLGFGHPFMNRGSVNLFVTSAYIYTTVNSLSMPFKLGAPLQVVGSLTQDRGAGVAGYLGKPPETVELRVKVTDREFHTTRELKAQVANEPGLIVSLMSAAALQGLDQGIDRIGAGTSRIVFQVTGQGLPRPVVRDNMFFNSLDISAVSLAEFLETLQLVVDNEFQAIKLDTVEISAQIEAGRRTAALEKAKPTVTEAHPGELVDVEVVIRPYRGQRETKILRLPIPDSAQPGAIHVTVRGGGLGYLYPDIIPFHDVSQQEAKKMELESIGPPSSADSLEKLLGTVLDREKNHEIVMEYIPYYDSYVIDPVPSSEPASESDSDDQETGSSGEETDKAANGKTMPAWNDEQTEPVRVTLPTRYVIEGQTSFEIAIAVAGEPDGEVDREASADDDASDEDEVADGEEVEEDTQDNRLKTMPPE